MGKIRLSRLFAVGIISLLVSVLSILSGRKPPVGIPEYSWSGQNNERSASESATLIRIVDGDTIEVSLGGAVEKVRLMGIDAPESVDPRRPVECYGKESSSHLSLLLAAPSIYLESESTAANRDTYNRLLRYVFTSQGELVNKTMIEDGYAFEYTYDIPYTRRDEFIRAEHDARKSALGLWSPSACAGKR